MKCWFSIFRKKPFPAVFDFMKQEWITDVDNKASALECMHEASNKPIVWCPRDGTTVIVGDRAIVEATVNHWFSLL